MNRGDVYLADLEPSQGSEANKTRPVVLVGNNASLAAAGRAGKGVVTIVPCTSNAARRGPMHVALQPTRLNGLRVATKVQVEQIRSIDATRLVTQIGKLGIPDREAIEDALRYHLAL